jgi:hypothetical protein
LFFYLNLRGFGATSAPLMTSNDDEWRGARDTETSFHQNDPVALTS